MKYKEVLVLAAMMRADGYDLAANTAERIAGDIQRGFHAATRARVTALRNMVHRVRSFQGCADHVDLLSATVG
jgi:hypothetical protein